jgi:hypothetical protein
VCLYIGFDVRFCRRNKLFFKKFSHYQGSCEEKKRGEGVWGERGNACLRCQKSNSKYERFSKPVYSVERHDSEENRQKIMSISYSEWKKMGFSKGILHYIKQNA